MGNLGKIALEKQAKKFDGQSNVDVANKLLIENTNQDYEILLHLGLSDHELDSKLNSLGEYKRISEYEEEYGYCVNRETLEDIAYKYDLTLAKSKYYKYSVPVSIVAEIKEWTKLTGIKTADTDAFYILAPSEAFYTEDEWGVYGGKKQTCKNSLDPMLVHQIAGSSREYNPVYSLITEWGSDLNPLRKIRAYLVNKAKTFTALSLFAIIMTITLITYHVINTMTSGFVGNDWVTIIMSILTFIGATILAMNVMFEIEPENKPKSRFDYTELSKNYNVPIIYYYNRDGTSEFSRFFANLYAIFLLISLGISFLFLLFFVNGQHGSFAEDLALSEWYFAIPLGITGILFVVGLLGNFFENLDWG